MAARKKAAKSRRAAAPARKSSKRAEGPEGPKRPRTSKAPAKPRSPAAAAAPPKPAPKGPKYPGPSVSLRTPMDVYEAKKDAFKAPIKELGLTWQFLGPGQGRYHDATVNVFARFGDAGVDYSVRGEAAKVERLVAAWRALGAVDRTEEAAAEEESSAVKAWRLEMPVRRPGEPEGFWKRRLAEWEARDPRKA